VSHVQVKFTCDCGSMNLGMEGFRHIPVEDLILDHELQLAKEKNCSSFKWPCSDCKTGRRKSIGTIRQHLSEVPRDPYLYHSMLGENPLGGFLVHGIWVLNVERTRKREGRNMSAELFEHEVDKRTVEFLDLEHDFQQQVFGSLHMTDDFLDKCMRNSEHSAEYEAKVSDIKELENLYMQVSVPVWRVEDRLNNISVISAIVVIMTMCTTHDVSNAFTDKLLKYLSTTLLPKNNSIPQSFYHAKNTVWKMGLNYNVIHCCPLGHVLFRGEMQFLDECPYPRCGLSRWMPG
jgi:hypothetical protein